MGPSTAATAAATEATVAGNCNLQHASGAAAAASSIKTDQVDRRQAQQKNKQIQREMTRGAGPVCRKMLLQLYDIYWAQNLQQSVASKSGPLSKRNKAKAE